MRAPLLLIAAAGLAAFGFAARAQLVAPPVLGNARDGAQIFARCQRCHSLEPGRNRIGPTLYGVFGRKAGSVKGYRYSRALRRSRLVWNEDTLSLYLANPRRFAPDDKLAANCRVTDPARLGDLLAYLEQATN